MHCVIKLKKEDGKLVATSQSMRMHYMNFVGKLAEDDLVEVYYEMLEDTQSLGQLARVHCMIRDLSQHTGTTFEGMKLLVKEKSGLFTIRTVEDREVMYCKSFADCSKEDLNLAIQACIEIGETVGCIVN